MTIAGAEPSTPIGRVIADLDRVRHQLPASDGIAVFIDMYRQVTESVAQRVSNRSFDDPPFVEALDVVFAGFFLAVPRAIAAGRTVPNSWAPLVDRRKARLFPLQFALAGMNAHINHDLALALVKTCSQRGLDPNRGTVHADFVRINDVLAELVRPLRQSFLDKELVRHGAALSPLADLLTNFSMEKARDAAWSTALTFWAVRDLPFIPEASEQALAGTVGLVSKQLLTRFDPLGHIDG